MVRREGVTVLNQTPSAFRQLQSVDERVGGELALRYVIFGGEALELERRDEAKASDHLVHFESRSP